MNTTTKTITIRYHRDDPDALVDAVDAAIAWDWPDLSVQFRDDGPIAAWRVDVPEDHGVEDCEGDEYTPYALWTSLCGTITEAANDAGFSDPL